MGEALLVTRSDRSTHRYTLEGEHNDGSIVLKPDTSEAAILQRLGATPLDIEDLERIAGQRISR